MPSTRQRVYEAALELPEAERLRLVQELLETLNPDAEGAFDDAWCSELDRRLNEFREGNAGDVAWSDLRDEE